MQSKTIKNTPFILSFFVVALFTLAYLPALQMLVEKWADSEEYSHAFLTLPIILYMVWTKRQILSEIESRYPSLGLLLILLSSLLYLFALLTEVHTIIALSTYLTIVGCLVYLFGVTIIKELFTPLLLLLILIPVPEQLFIKLTFPLQLKVSQASEFIIRIFGIPLLREGNLMTIPEKTFEVVDACSGLRSSISLLTLSVIMGYYMVQKIPSKLILLAASIPTAIAVNIFRVSIMILVYHFFGLDLTEGTWHTATGLGVFVLAFAFLFLIQRILERWETK